VDDSDQVYFAPAWTYDVCQFTAERKVRRHFKRHLARRETYQGGVSSERTPWTVVVFDIAISPGTQELYVLRARSVKEGAVVDVWSFRRAAGHRNAAG
jgi:hypothetical protein